jgi:hypothetical protein
MMAPGILVLLSLSSYAARMKYIEMDPALAWKSIEGYQNELDAEQKGLDAFYRQFKCKQCGGPLQKEFLTKHAFSDPNTMNPRAVLRCTLCKWLFDPHSGLVLEVGEKGP